MNTEKVNTLVFSGAAALLTSQLQLLKRLVDSRMIDMKKVNSFAGTSAGACISVLLCTGATVDEAINIFKTNLGNSPFSENIVSNVINLLGGYGLFSFDRFNKLFDASIKPYGILDRSTTFRELWLRTKKDIFITGTNVSKRRLEIFSHYTTPEMPVLIAMQMSMSAVPYFKNTTYNGDTYIDGAYLLSYPINVFLDPEMIFESREQRMPLNIDYVNLNSFRSDNRQLFPECQYNYTYCNSIKKQPEEVLGICVTQIIYKGGNSLTARLANFICFAVNNTFSKACFDRTIHIVNTLDHPSFDFSLDSFNYFIQLGDSAFEDFVKKNKTKLNYL